MTSVASRSLPLAGQQDLQPSSLPRAQVPGLYVHIPFCFHKCHYCDFYSITRQTDERMHRFVDVLLSEADQWRTADGPTLRPRTVFFGGGTPTLLPIDAMKRLVEGLITRFDFSDVREWTIEANPATLRDDYAAMLRSLGVDRLSFGAQSFDRSELATLERHHDPDDVPRSIEIARRAGFERLNLDLIYAIPGQTSEAWSRSLEAAIALGTTHISAYGLTYEPNTPMAVRKRLGQFQGVEESVELEMFHLTRDRLSAIGIPPYEVSNYARPEEECLHNLGYWTGDDYIGLGPSAASHVQGWRWKNRAHLGEWESAIAAGKLPARDVEHLDPLQRARELAMLLLRLSNGLNFADFARRTGYDARETFSDVIANLSRASLIQADSEGLRLVGRGWDLADAVASEFLA